MADSMTGRVFNNRYQITERIGIGGMAEVYRAQDNVLGRLVAVKVMLPQYAADSSFTERFRQEAAAAANLQSPYIVNIYDWGQDEGTYYIVMEFVRGSDLKTAILERGAINQRKVAEIGAQVCQALSVAHSQDIIHRDIKPQNIMVQPDGNVKVMDFGIARAKNSVKTQTSSVLGTAHYISPEQAQGKELTAATDIYSLGVVLYEAATGQLPFDAPDAVSVAMKQVNEQPVPPRQINPEIDPSLEAIIMKAMQKNPNDRFATAKDMRKALNDYLAGRPVDLDEDFTSAQTAILGAVPPIDSTMTMPIAAAAQSEGTTTRAPQNDDSSKKKRRNRIIAIVVGIVAALVVVGIILFVIFGTASGEMVTVPDVLNMERDEAIAKVEDEGFVAVVTEENSDTVESGYIISQDPEGNTQAEKGSTVTLVVSIGTAEITVPDLSNMTADEAKKELSANGLKAKEGEAEYSDTVEKDHIIRQDIAAGTKVAKDTTVTYYLSKGPEGIEVPYVVGMGENSATAALEDAGFYVATDYSYSDSVDEGYVISQNPSSGRLDAGKTVSIEVSLGRQLSTFSVSVNWSGEGSVSASSSSVTEGDSVSITITPSSGYEVASVSGLDGVSSSGGTYTISNISWDVYIDVEFQQIPTATDEDGGDEG